MLNDKYSERPIRGENDSGRRIARLSATLLGLTLAGCGAAPVCGDSEPYLEARAVPPLKVPGGLDAPTHAGGMNVPATPPAASAPAPAAAQTASARPAGKCLDEAPSYFGTPISPLSSPEEVVAVWAEAWSERRTDNMMAAYSQRFAAPEGTTSATWLEQRREQVATGPVPAAGVQGLKVTQAAPDRWVATFAQRFENNSIRRELTLVRENGFWRIIAERVIDLE